MSTRILSLTLVLIAVSLHAEVLPSVELPGPLERVLRDYERAWTAGDEKALAALFAEDGFVLASGKDPVRGRAQIEVAYEDSGGGPLALRALAYQTNGPTGWIIGAYGPEPGRDSGKFILALERARGGKWMIAADIDNSNRRSGTAPPDAAGRDEFAIRDTIQMMARSVDLHQWDQVRSAFAPRVALDYGEPESVSPDTIIERWRPLLTAFDWTRHELSSLKIDRDGDRATATADFAATHFIAEAPEGESWVLRGSYRFELERTPAGWKITGMNMTPGESTGNANLLEMAKARVENNH